MSMKNDVSFILDTRLSLYEQQSTVCVNMPLRDLMYVSKQFEELTAGRDIYSGSLIRLPAPKFITFYNGKRPQPERVEQRLSDAYYRSGADAGETPDLELKVLQLNINPGFNEALKQKCPTLLQYMEYVECVRRHEGIMPLWEAVEAAVDECIQKGILRDFLLREKARVVSMSIFEFDQELHDKTIRSESWEDGWTEGRTEGERFKLVTQVCRKLRKGKSAEMIAEELEEDIGEIRLICDAAGVHAPEYDAEQVFASVSDRTVC